MRQELQKKVDAAIKLLQSISNAYGGKEIEVAYSGGKDSDVILELTKMAGIPYRAIYKNTTIDPPGTIKHGQINECLKAMGMIMEHGFKGQFFLYCMLNGDFNESFSRVKYWWEFEQCTRMYALDRCHVYAYAQPYRDPINPRNPIPQWQKDMAGWVNKKAHFVAHSFEDFEPRKGFRCAQYVEQYKN